jgi:hypothetical protein
VTSPLIWWISTASSTRASLLLGMPACVLHDGELSIEDPPGFPMIHPTKTRLVAGLTDGG